jgi:threonine synthase
MAPELNFEEAMLSGLARDRGLYLPKFIPVFEKKTIKGLVGKSYEEIAFKVMEPFVKDTFSETEFRDAIEKSYSQFRHPSRAPLKKIDGNHFLLELFHGPTLAFKDFAMQLIGQLFRISLMRSNKSVTIIGATSGDTGSAAIEAFKGLTAVNVFIFFPRGRISEIQQLQMSTPKESNVHAISIDGDFDDCQKAVKDMFSDLDFRDKVNLSGINSVNWARIMAQMVYYFSSYLALDCPEKNINFSVPTGNFGDVFAGFMAKKMGLPISNLIIATNQNDILHKALTTSHYIRKEVNPSISPSMDIQVSSNFERALYYALEGDTKIVRDVFKQFSENGRFKIPALILKKLQAEYLSGRVSEVETTEIIKKIQRRNNLAVCPHTAVGIKVAEKNLGDDIMISLATAHPGKFLNAYENATGKKPEIPDILSKLSGKEERITELKTDLSVIKKFILERI